MIMEQCHLVLEFWQMGIVLRVVNKKPTRYFCQAIHLNNYNNYLCTPGQFCSILTRFDASVSTGVVTKIGSMESK